MSLVSQFLAGGGLSPRQQVFTSSGTFVPSSKLLSLGGWVHVFLVGGGGGGKIDLIPHPDFFYGGGGGAVVGRVVQVTGNVAVTIGAGGSGGENPTDGGNSTFGSLLTAEGGKSDGRSGNGHYGPSFAGAGAGGPGGVNFSLSSGFVYLYSTAGGPGVDGYGAGGSGGVSASTYNAPPNTGNGGGFGGNGGSGICIVTWWE